MLKRLCTFAFVILILPFSSPLWAAVEQKILLVGDSLGASYGVPSDKGWVALLNARLAQEGRPVKIINASISGDTTAGGRARLQSLLQQEQPQWVLIELGGNDGLRGLNLKAMRDNLEAMVAMVREQGAQPALVGIKIPPNYGRKYRDRFEQVFVDISEQQNVPLLPFLLENVGGVGNYMQDDRIHPNTEAQPLIADNVWTFLQALMQVKSGAESRGLDG
jgi:acyl-CoA thioesterase-1